MKKLSLLFVVLYAAFLNGMAHYSLPADVYACINALPFLTKHGLQRVIQWADEKGSPAISQSVFQDWESSSEHGEEINSFYGLEYTRSSVTDYVRINCLCGSTFSSNAELKEHIAQNHRVNNKFICPKEECRSKFYEVHFLSEHIKKHAGAYSCAICYEKYSTLRDLKKHIETHCCEYCQNVFLCAKSMRRHMKACHTLNLQIENQEIVDQINI